MQSEISLVLNKGPDSEEWAKVFNIIDNVNRDPSSVPVFLNTVFQTTNKENKQERLSALMLIDAIFRNCKQPVINELTHNPSIFALSDNNFLRDTEYYRTLFNDLAEWIEIAQRNGTLTPQFSNWHKEISNIKLQKVVNKESAKKFTVELTACIELLMIFHKTIKSAVLDHDISSSSILPEIIPNIVEVNSRLKEIKDTFKDQYVKDVICYIEEYCTACKVAYDNFEQSGTCDFTKLDLLEANGFPKRLDAPKPPEDSDDYSSDDSYEEFMDFLREIAEKH